MKRPQCRFCGAGLRTTFVDLGMSPLSNAFVEADRLREMEAFFSLHVWLCDSCLLVQLEEFEKPEAIFKDYPYFSSFSDSWLAHARQYVEMIRARLGLGPESLVIEVASNDGYLLQYFVERGIPVLGIEPAANVARAAESKGVPTLVRFFGAETARAVVADKGPADLIVGNNVLAHVPDINDFVDGLRLALSPSGVATLEFPHLLRLIEGNQYDTIYHEHFSYFSLLAAERIFTAHGLAIFDVEELPTHGGSLRVFLRHRGRGEPPSDGRVAAVRQAEVAFGLDRAEAYASFRERVERNRWDVLEFLIRAAREGKKVAGYGAPAKGNTLLNFCGIREDLLSFTVDRSPHKQGRFLPGVHIPIAAPDRIVESRPDYLVLLPWNLKDEIMEQQAVIRTWGGRFVTFIPEVRVVS